LRDEWERSTKQELVARRSVSRVRGELVIQLGDMPAVIRDEVLMRVGQKTSLNMLFSIRVENTRVDAVIESTNRGKKE
jgi:hypothetical protein